MASFASGPPVSPDVMAQQMPSPAAYAQQGQAMLNGGQSDSGQANPDQFVMSELNDIATKLGNVAKVLSQTHKELIPIIQKMATAGSMLQNELQANNPPQSAETPPQADGQGGMSLG